MSLGVGNSPFSQAKKKVNNNNIMNEQFLYLFPLAVFYTVIKYEFKTFNLFLCFFQVEEQIRFLYQSLQKFAVGLEAIVLDQACYGQQFYYHFNEAEYQLKYVSRFFYNLYQMITKDGPALKKQSNNMTFVTI